MSLLNAPKPFLQTNAWQHGQNNSLRYNTSQAGSVLPLGYGTFRQQVNLIDFGDYRGPKGKKGKTGPLPITGQRAGKGGGGSGGKKGVGGKKNHDFSVDVAFALCQGPVDIGNTNFVWSSAGAAFFQSVGLNLYTGTYTQTADPVFVGLGHNIAYAGTCYVTGTPMDLGNSPVIPNLSFEVTGFEAGTAGTAYPKDANPGNIISDFLTNPEHGAGFPSANLDSNVAVLGVDSFRDYCQAAQLVMSPVLQVQTEAASWLHEMMKLVNTAIVWSGKLLRFIPYGDLALSSNGATWTPNLVPEYSLDDRDFLPWVSRIDSHDPQPGEDDPVLVDRSDPTDLVNWLSIEYLDRSNQYNKNVAPQFDQAMIDLYGLKTDTSVQGNCFCDITPALVSASLMLQRSLYVRNKYKFQLGWRHMLLEPMDIVLITDVHLNIFEQAVRILVIEENKNGDFTIEAEEIVTEIPVPPPGLCLNTDMAWRLSAPNLTDNEDMPPDRLDSSGNMYVVDPYDASAVDESRIYDTNGSLVNTLDYTGLWNKIFAFAGINHGPIIGDGSGAYEYYEYYKLSPIYDGQYILAYIQRDDGGTSHAFWWALLDPATLNVLGAYYYNGIVAWPYAFGYHVLGALATDQPILVQCYAFIASTSAVLGVLPSIDDFIGGTYAAGQGGGPFRLNNTLIYPIGGTTDFSNHLFNPAGQPQNNSRNFGFLAPAADGSPNLYIYANRAYMDYTTGSTARPNEFHNVIQPGNPLGAMIKIPLGFLDFAALSTTLSTTTIGGPYYGGGAGPAYSIDNANWKGATALVPGIPFSDEYTHISDDTVGGSDVYSLQQGFINRGSGKFWIIFYMVGTDDAAYRNVGGVPAYTYPIMERVKVFEYTQSTETARQIAERTCALHNLNDSPADSGTATWESSNDGYQIFTVEDSGGTATLWIHGHIFKRSFMSFPIP